MPWIVLLCVAGVAACGFSSDYKDGHFTCTDGVCPSGLACVANQCVAGDAAPPIDGDIDATTIDAHVAALTCGDPGTPTGTITGSTTSHANTVSASCSTLVMNGPDAIYRVTATATKHIMLTIDGLAAYAPRALVMAPCTAAPQTPVCIGNTYASEGNPASIVAPVTGTYYVIVDSEIAASSGDYSLAVSVEQ